MSSEGLASRDAKKIVFEAFLFAVGFSALGVVVNLVRSDGIPLVPRAPIEIFVPCKEVSGEVKVLDPSDSLVFSEETFLIDAREKEAYEEWHISGAKNIPFDYLEGVDDAEVREIVRSSKKFVVVYGDGQDPDSGEQLAKELAGKGIRNVHFVKGGAKALRFRQ